MNKDITTNEKTVKIYLDIYQRTLRVKCSLTQKLRENGSTLSIRTVGGSKIVHRQA